jgi:hypothetical protein
MQCLKCRLGRSARFAIIRTLALVPQTEPLPCPRASLLLEFDEQNYFGDLLNRQISRHCRYENGHPFLTFTVKTQASLEFTSAGSCSRRRA